MRRIFYISSLIITGLFLTLQQASAQMYRIKGTVYDSSRTFPMEGVSVLSTSGRGTSTNVNGHYEIDVSEKDSIWFSYLNKPTVKFPVLKIVTPLQFDIAIEISVPELREVKIRQPDYKLDSIQNREEYAKVFNFQKPKLQVGPSTFGAGVGLNLDDLVDMLRFKHNKSMLDFRQRLLQQEQDKFIDHRFNKGLVRRLTNLSGEELDSFMIVYRPSYMFTSLASDYDFQKYITDAFARFQKGLPPVDALKPEEKDF